MHENFSKASRLRKRRDFGKVSKAGYRRYGKYIRAEILPSTSCSRLGITVTKRFGKAHERNRFKRVVREAFRLSVHRFKTPVDLVIKPKAKGKLKMQDIQRDICLLVSP